MNAREAVVDQILKRGVIVQVLPNLEQFRERLISDEPLRIYIGADPTSSSLHLSHAKNYQLLEEFRQLGHHVFVLFGDFTARIGDPSGRASKRKQLSPDEVKTNVAGWIKQIRPLLDFSDDQNPPRVVYNYDWLSKITMEQLLRLGSLFTVQQMLERDMFQNRMKRNMPIHLHEFLYPLMQGYDSVALDVDAELCGTDQIFNALVGRDLQKTVNGKDKFVVAVNLMENPKTGELMSKSRGAGVFLDSSPFDMYGAVMAQPDEMIRVFLVNNTRVSLDTIDKVLATKSPRDAKMFSAKEITTIFHGESAAMEAETRFIKLVQNKEASSDVPRIIFGADQGSAFDIVRHCLDRTQSNSEIRRLLAQKAIHIDDAVVPSGATIIRIPRAGLHIRIGKKRWFLVLPGVDN